ncbi:MAG: hypothetical protein PVF91_01100 [Chromatiales bacterium]|jgi:hypothetical protein
MNRYTGLALGLAAVLSIGPGARVMAADTTQSYYAAAVRDQSLVQGRMLIANLQQAREQGLRGDRWGMAYALEEARRLLDAMAFAERMKPPSHSSGAGEPPTRPLPKSLSAPLAERVDVDAPLSGGRNRRLGELQQAVGSIPMSAVAAAIHRALYALRGRSGGLGAALLATNSALAQVRWQGPLQPTDWSRVRDEVLQAYALILERRPGAAGHLAEAKRILAGLPDGGAYARRVARLQQAPPDRAALETLARDLDARVESTRAAAERSELSASGGKTP